MPGPLDRFLGHHTGISRRAALGRAFDVTCETWPLTADPRKVPPSAETLVTRKTASEAADFAREAAEALPWHGFHKPSGAWWGADETTFHRFVVHPRRRRRTAAPILIASGLAGLLAVALVRRGRSGKS